METKVVHLKHDTLLRVGDATPPILYCDMTGQRSLAKHWPRIIGKENVQYARGGTVFKKLTLGKSNNATIRHRK